MSGKEQDLFPITKHKKYELKRSIQIESFDTFKKAVIAPPPIAEGLHVHTHK